MQVGLENPVNEDLDIKELNQAKQDCIAHGTCNLLVINELDGRFYFVVN